MKMKPLFLTLPLLYLISGAVAKPSPKPPAKAAAKPATKPAGPPPGTEVAKFVLPPAPYRSDLNPIRKEIEALRPTKPRGLVYLPKGAANVALGKKVTSSDDAPIIGELKMLTDGDKNPYEGSWVELAPGKQWIQIDLGQTYDMHGVLLWHYHGNPRVYHDVVVQVANDEAFTKNVRTVFNNDQDNSSGLGAGKDREFYELAEGQWIPFAQTARFVRFYSNGNSSDTQNQYTEAEVWASPIKAAAKAKVAPKGAKPNRPPSAPPGMMKAPFKLPPAGYN
jgi:hypothetical protein